MFKTKITPLALIIASISASASAELIISEYVEGSGFNKAIEIYNTSSAEVSLNGYSLSLYSNGSGSASVTEELTGLLAANSTYVIVTSDSRANDELKLKAQLFSGAVNFNGDDALVLMQGSNVIDSFGQRGVKEIWSAGA